MTAAQKILIKKLLTGHFLRKMKRRNQEWYVVYDEKRNPIMKVRMATVKRMDQFIYPQKLWKTSLRGDITLNLTTVRQLHGKTTLNKLYKQRDQLVATGAIYKTRKKKTTKKQTDEKANYLF